MANNPLYLLWLLGVSFALGLLIALIYKKSKHSPSFSQSFVTTLVLLMPVVTLVIMFISNNIARAIGVFGAFSIIRFRTPIKDARDMFFIFWVLATGLVIGVGEPLLAVTATVTIAMMVYLLDLLAFGSFSLNDYLLEMAIDKSKSDFKDIEKLIEKNSASFDILNLRTSPDEGRLFITASVKLGKKIDLDTLQNRLLENKAVIELEISPANFQLQY